MPGATFFPVGLVGKRCRSSSRPARNRPRTGSAPRPGKQPRPHAAASDRRHVGDAPATGALSRRTGRIPARENVRVRDPAAGSTGRIACPGSQAIREVTSMHPLEREPSDTMRPPARPAARQGARFVRSNNARSVPRSSSRKTADLAGSPQVEHRHPRQRSSMQWTPRPGIHLESPRDSRDTAQERALRRWEGRLTGWGVHGSVTPVNGA